ncbi:secreted RxLR effector protein 161-like [Salvia splendens]|uniref:secreted RxLR effector protein 161-like n=1 Tax=Salvia splendens TaxID=180675 RepID=UPI001C267D63|nr:secreted RxLR effector protein 161-like [Salvia splendens]
MFDAKPASVLLAAHFMLSKDLCPKSEYAIKAMKKVPYANAIGSVMYLMVSTRPDIAYAVSCLSRYMSNPGPVHWEALKWLLRYPKNTAKYGLCYSRCEEGVKLIGYVDSNYANDRDKRKSTTSNVFTVCRSCMSLKSQLQHIVALSTTESEYIAIIEVMKEVVWLKGVLSELNFLKTPPVVFSDSQSAIQLYKNLVFHDRTKHIDVRFHYIRDIVEKNEVSLLKVHTDKNPADMGTKCLPLEKLFFCIKYLHFDLG